MSIRPQALRIALAGLLPLFAFASQASTVHCPLTIGQSEDEQSWLQQAEAGDACAQFNIGYRFYTRQRYAESARWYAMAAEQGVSRAAFEIALLYRDELLPDPGGERVRWMTLAAEQGQAPAQMELGIDYLENPGGQDERIQAMSWLEKAALQGDAQGMYLLGELFWGDDMEFSASDDDEQARRFSSSESMALYWICQAAEKDHAPAQLSLSNAYSHGRGTPSDQVQRRLWLERAASNGSEEARQWLDTSDMAWYSRLERWLEWQMVDESARCPDEALTAAIE